MQQYESQDHKVGRPVAEAYARLSDLSQLAALREKIDSPEVQEKFQQIPEAQRDTVRKALQTIRCDADSLSVDTPLGAITLRIVERQPQQSVKMQAENTPIPLAMWLHFKADGDAATLLRVVIGAEVNFFMRGMVSGPLSKAAEGLASVLAMV
ncbi:MAG: hypothetical protein J6M53_01260 [Bacteroidaceae bacterium]|nr:hypothetical protein [Bacteroidaceae bacterium]